MTPWINYHHLFYFKTIAEEGSVSKAAEKLRLGQPTLSSQLKQLEESLDTKLFDRRHKKLIITEQGKVALDYAKSIFQKGSEMYEVLQGNESSLKPHLRVGTLDSVAKQITMKFVKSSMDAGPCQITLSEGSPEQMLELLLLHKIDVYITNASPTGLNTRDLYIKRIKKEKVAFFASAKFKKLKKNFPESINHQNLVLPTYDSKLREDIDHWAKQHKLQLDILVESQDIGMKKLLAVEGFGIMAAAKHTVENQVKAKALYEIGSLNDVYEELYLVTAKRQRPNKVLKSAIDNFLASI